jgi:hypothetical protein
VTAFPTLWFWPFFLALTMVSTIHAQELVKYWDRQNSAKEKSEGENNE